MSDYIASLPTDETPLTTSESELVEEILKKDTGMVYKLLKDLQDPLFGGILFILLNLPFVKSMIEEFVPYAKSSEVSSLLFRVLLFVVLFFFFKNLGLVIK
jgi:hypothetical protein